ncbi:hypothetical protein DIS24_g5233 [Lasiodiplodia hormozganensis]|uniref:C2H2-type domain-containing protein n=1 Tax=Lasiodiplodia hormozganensis TaxID=869390 RepID=A0AA40CWX1_9PEZI|nr:hypothetical protein DIS24_g5233 [Lasiodiplodia hormozganensis]
MLKLLQESDSLYDMDGQRKSEERKDAVPPRSNGKEPSMSSRIAASASGLAKDMLGNASAGEAQSAFASGSGLSRKLQSSTAAAGPSTWSQMLPSRQNGSSSRASNGSGESFRSQEGFRSSPTQHGSEESHFELDVAGIGSPDFTFDEFIGVGREEEKLAAHWARDFQNDEKEGRHAQEAKFELGFASNGHVEYDDGAEVRLLLADPAFSAEDAADSLMADPTPETVNDLFSQDFSTEEKEIVDKIKSTLPAPPQHNRVSPENPLNLRPEFASLSASNPQLEEEIRELSRTLGSGDEGVMAFNKAQQQHWLTEWDDVLNSYTDEVWGEMLPVVKAARSQLEEVKTGMDRLDSKAVARLRMILGHVVETKQTTSSIQQYAVQPPLQDDSEWQVPTFHCPYVSCHERFRNEAELRTHSQQHGSYSCPHFDCGARFEEAKEWADHINRSHHGLLKTEDEDL